MKGRGLEINKQKINISVLIKNMHYSTEMYQSIKIKTEIHVYTQLFYQLLNLLIFCLYLMAH